MTNTEKKQQLHHRATIGEKLSPDEQETLQNWYAELDREEELMLDNSGDIKNLTERREQLNATLAEITEAAANVERIAKQNEVLRRENEVLRKVLESRLPELLTA